MKKRIMSFIMVLCMVIALLPATAMADSPEMYVGSTDVSTDSTTPIYWKGVDGDLGTYASTGTSEDYLFSVAWDGTSNSYTLTLNGVDITKDFEKKGIYSSSNLNIVLADNTTNTIVMPSVEWIEYGVNAQGSIAISGNGTLDVTVNSEEQTDRKFGIYAMGGGITITHSHVNVTKHGDKGDAVYARQDIRVLGDAKVTLVDWSTSDGDDCGFHSDNGNVAIGGSAIVDICSQSKGIFAGEKVYIGYTWDETAESGAGGYVIGGNPEVNINDAAMIAEITPSTEDDFVHGRNGIYGNNDVFIAGGEVAATGKDGIFANNDVSITGGKVTATGENAINTNWGGVNISGADTQVTASTKGSNEKERYHGICSGDEITINDAKVVISQSNPRGFGIYSISYIRISGGAEVNVTDWSSGKGGGIYCTDDTDVRGDFAIGGNAKINVCSQAMGISSFADAYIGYVWDANANSGAGGYVPNGTPTVNINDAADIAAITPDIPDDFNYGSVGLLGFNGIHMAGGTLEAAGKMAALYSENILSYTNLTNPAIVSAKFGDPTVEVTDLSQVICSSEQTGKTYKYEDNMITYIKMGSSYNISKATPTGGNYTVKVNDAEVTGALPGKTVILSATPNSGYSFTSWNVYQTGNAAEKVTVTDNTFIMPAYGVTVEAVFTQKKSSSTVENAPQRTIAVTETTSKLFKNTDGQIKAEANMSNAFSNSVEVKVKETKEDASNFGLASGSEVYPFDISLYIKGTETKTEPNSGYAVTISLPIPEKLLGEKEKLSIVHKDDNGKVTTLSSKLTQANGIWYLVFEANEFSPYALVVSKETANTEDEPTGVPYYKDSDGNTVFIGFAANKKYISPDGAEVMFKNNSKSFTDVNGHWAASNINFVTEREIFVGSGKDTFSPNTGMTRAMFAAVIGRLYERSYGEIKPSAKHAFTDCNYDSYYGKYVDWAAENGILSGYKNAMFKPDEQITREQMAAILYHFAEFMGTLAKDADAALNYADASAISNWAKSGAIYCQNEGIISGRDGGKFVPKDVATRAEVAAILKRFIENVVK